MNLTNSTLPVMDASQGAAVYGAALGKKMQKLEGEAALKLLASAASVSAATVASSTPTGSLGHHIDIRV